MHRFQRPRKDATCPDCGRYGLPVRTEFDGVMRCPECLCAFDVRHPTLPDLEDAVGRRAETYRRTLALPGDVLSRIESAVTPTDAVTLARDVHGVYVLRHRLHGTYRGGSLRDVLVAFAGGLS